MKRGSWEKRNKEYHEIYYINNEDDIKIACQVKEGRERERKNQFEEQVLNGDGAMQGPSSALASGRKKQAKERKKERI